MKLGIYNFRFFLSREAGKLRQLAALMSFIAFFQMPLDGQVMEEVTLKYVNARFSDSVKRDGVIVVIFVSATDSAHFPPKVILPPKSTVFEMGFEKVVLIDPHNIGMEFNGSDVAVRSPETYRVVEGKLDLAELKSERPAMLVTYKIYNIPYTFSKMSLTPVFEDNVTGKKISRRFEFTVN